MTAETARTLSHDAPEGRARARRRRSKLILRALVSLLLGATALFAVRGVHLHDIVARIRSFPLLAVFAALGAAALQITSQLTRLWAVFPERRRPTWPVVARAFTFGQLINMYLPARTGDVVKVLTLAGARASAEARHRTSVAEATSAVITDKGVDLLTMLLIGGCVMRGLLRFPWPSAAPLVAGAAGLALALVLVRLVLPRVWPKGAAKLGALGRAMRASARALWSPVRLARGIALGVVGALAEAIGILVLCDALGAPISITGALCVLIVLGIASAVPVAFANLGVFEGAIAFGLSRFGVSTADAITVGVVHHVVQLSAIGVAAFVCWCHDRARRSREEAAPTELILPPRSTVGRALHIPVTARAPHPSPADSI